MAENTITINGTEYIQKDSIPTGQLDGQGTREPFLSFLRSPQFWMIGVAAIASILMAPDFQTMPWNQIVGQILTIWGSGSAGYGLINKTAKIVSAK